MPLIKSLKRFFRYEKKNYRRGGLFMIPGITLGIFLAWLFGDKGTAMSCIAFFGYTTALILIIIGDRSERPDCSGGKQ